MTTPAKPTKRRGYRKLTPEMRVNVRAYYVFNHLKLSQAAERANVSYATAMNWKKKAKAEGDDWDLARTANLMAGAGLHEILRTALEEYMLQHEMLMTLLRQEAQRIAAIPPPKEDTDTTRMSLLEKCTRLTSQLCGCQARMLDNYARSQPEVHKLGLAYDVVEKFTHFVQKKYPQHAVALLEVLEPFGNELNRYYA